MTSYQERLNEAMRAWANEQDVRIRISLWCRYVDVRDGLKMGTTAREANKSKIYYCRADDTIGLN